jgi:hypothetical protein
MNHRELNQCAYRIPDTGMVEAEKRNKKEKRLVRYAVKSRQPQELVW